MKFNTKLIHGNSKLDETGATNTPIYFSNAYAHNTAEEIEGIFKGTKMGYVYSRVGNPTVTAFERRMASVESGLVSLAAASGMTAIYTAIMNIASAGDEIIASAGIYGGTYTLLRNLKTFGIKVTFLKSLDEESLTKVITEETKIIFAETIGNPKLDILDIELVAKICNEENIIFMVDSTISTPYLINPIGLGADVVIHSTSKYINGNSNAIGGIIVDGGSHKYKHSKFESFKPYTAKFGKMAFSAKIKAGIGKDIGGAMSPMNAFLNLAGIETLALRMREHCKNALQVAEYLSTNSKVVSVNYPNLKSSKYYALSQKYYKNGAGGILTFRLGSIERAFKFINNLKLILKLPNIGDSKTLIVHPSSSICIDNTEEEKLNMEVYEDLVRLSVGIEDVEDIILDIENSLNSLD